MIARLLTLVACASLSLPTLAQWSTGYSTAPSYLLTFDSQPSNAALDASQGRFTWVPEVSGRQGAAYFDRTVKNYIDLKNFPDNLNRPIPNIGGEMSVEVMILQRDFAFWQRQWAFANTTVDSRGLPNSNPTGEYICMANSGTDTLYRLVTTEGTTETVVAAPGTSGRTGEWNHLVATFAIRDANAPSNQRAMTSLYVNGQLIINGTAYLPRTGPRTLNFLGRTEYMLNSDAYFMGYYDTFAVYTHPLSQEAAWAHAQTSRPPVFELTFSKNPTTLQGATTTPTYSWAEGSDLTRGLLVLSGSSQSVNLLTSTGTASVGTSMPTSINGASTGQPRSAGWSYTATVSLNALTANAAIFDARDAGNNRVRMYINAAGNVIFAMGNGVSITSSNTLQTGRFYHISAVVSSTGSATLYVDSQSVGTGTGSALAAFTVTQAFLGQSTDTTPVFLNGRIDSFRVYDIALSAAEVAGLASTISVAPTGNLVAPRPAPAKQSAPISSYSFNSPPPPLGQAGLTNFSWVPSLLGRQGMAFLDGTKGLVALKDYPNDQGGLIPTLFGGSMSFEVDFQYLSSANQAMVYSFAGPRSAVDNNLHLMNTYWQAGAGNINTLRSETYTQRDYAGNTQLDCLGCTNGSWAHGIVSIQQWNLSDSTSSRSALITMYINGQLVAQKYGTLPPVLHRPNLNLGQSGWAADALFYGNIDDFHFYNYGLSQEAASVHFTLPAPPAFEAVFAEDIRVGVATPSFSWQFNETATGDNVHQGMLMLSGGNQFANLSASSGANFIGFTFPPMIGNGRNTPGVATEQANGWSVNVVFKATSTASGVTIYDIASADGSNSLKLAFGNSNQVVFSHGSATLSCGAVAADEWTSIIIVVAQDGTNMDGQCYKNGVRVASSSTFPAVPYVSRNSVLLGRANAGTNTNFNGVIDAFHFLPYTVSSEDAAELQRVYSNLKRVVDAPAFFSGPTVSHTFDVPPALDFSDPTTAPTYNFWTWSEYGPPYAANAPNRRRGVAVFDRPGASRDLRQYIDLTFDQDAYGMVMPQQWGGSMSFEFWVNMASLRDWSRIFDCASNLGQDNWNSAAGEFSYNLLLSVRGDGATPRGLLFQHYAATGSGQPQYNVDVASPNGWNPGTWQYIVATVEQTSATNATMRVYVDGVLRGSTISPPPPVRQRQFCWIGRSNWNDNALNGTIDIFNYYNYALSQDQITRNMRLPNPPYFDASFETTPARGTSPTYGWVAQVAGATGHTGALTFNGVNQYVDLFSGSSASSIGQVFPTINGISVGIDQEGFSFEMSCLWSNVNGISRVFDLGNGNGVDSFAIGNVGNKAVLYVNNGLIDAESVIGLTQITVNTFYHFVIVGRPVGGANSTVMNYQVYVAGRLANTFNNRVAPARLSRRVSYLARSTIPSDQYFQGSVDLLRYYTYAVNADTASYLSTLAGPSAEYVPTGDIVFSSTGGGNPNPNPSSTTQTPGGSSSGVPAPTGDDGGDDGINGAASFSAVVALIASSAVALML